MSNCIHKLKFQVTTENSSSPREINIFCIIKIGCSLCDYHPSNEEINILLKKIYTQDISEIIFGLYENKKAYYKFISKLKSFDTSNSSFK